MSDENDGCVVQVSWPVIALIVICVLIRECDRIDDMDERVQKIEQTQKK